MSFPKSLFITLTILGLFAVCELAAQVVPTRPGNSVPQVGATGGNKGEVGGEPGRRAEQGGGYHPTGHGEPGAYAPAGHGEPGDPAAPGGNGEPGDTTPPIGNGGTGPANPGNPGGGSSGGGGGGGATGIPPIQPPGGFGTPGQPGTGGSGKPRGGGGETGPLGQGHSDDSWQNWWILNEGHMLDIERRYRLRSEAKEVSRDLFAGATVGDAATPIESRGLMVRRQTLPIFKRLLDHDYVRVRAEAAIAIGRAGAEEQVSWLAPLTKDRERDVRKAAIIGLGLLGEKAGLPYLEHILRDRSTQNIERAYAAVAIGLISDSDSINFLVDRLEKGKRVQEVDAALLYALGLIPDQRARRFLDNYVSHPLKDDVLRAVAVMGLGLQESPESLDTLKAALIDKDVRVRRSAAIAVGQIRFVSEYRAEWDELETVLALGGPDAVPSDRVAGELESYRARLIVQLEEEESKLKTMRDEVIDLIAKEALEDSDIMVRNFSLIALAELGGERAQALIRSQLYDAGLDSTRSFAALAMAVLGGQTAGQDVHRRLGQRSMDQESKAAMTLSLGLLSEVAAVDQIRKQFKSSGDASLARATALALGLLGDERAKRPLRELLTSKSRPELKRAYGQALALLGDYEMVELAGKILNQRGSVSNKVELAEALAQVFDQRSLGTLLEAVEMKDRKDLVLAAIVRALGLLAERGEGPLLAPKFRHLNYSLRFQSLNEIALI